MSLSVGQRWRTLNLAGIIDSPTICKLLSLIRSLQAQGNRAAEIHRRMSHVCGVNFLSDGVVLKWCREFQNSRTYVHDEDGQERKSVACEDLAQRVDQLVRERDGGDFHLVRELKTGLGEQHFHTNEEL
ncbi:hypothetical protein AVEN_154806-1 [Araneus ventricosus]|uniref:Mos1 transposase HTH domain-containing protein n=1 Tax=Araneus ventricosus TaxID=182803 RepID=A0A4Y2BWB7_ARAVE|nr:hypothetical protein AVEN_154806-1 [Araneus ventricosus]